MVDEQKAPELAPALVIRTTRVGQDEQELIFTKLPLTVEQKDRLYEQMILKHRAEMQKQLARVDQAPQHGFLSVMQNMVKNSKSERKAEVFEAAKDTMDGLCTADPEDGTSKRKRK